MKKLLLLLFASVLMFASELKLLTEEWPPYNYKYEGKIKGIGPEVSQLYRKS